MAYTETTKTGYGTRLGNSLKGIIVGLAFFAAGTGMLFWNEGNFVKNKKALEEGQNIVVPVTDVSKIDSNLNGKFIHASAMADTKDTLTDDLLGVKENSVKLNRKVEYYQWVEKSKTETKDKIGGSEEKKTTYTYEKKWTNEPINSSEFKDPFYQNKNFIIENIESQEIQSENVSFGAYKLPNFIISSIEGSTPAKISLDSEKQKIWNDKILKNTGHTNTVTPTDTTKTMMLAINNNVAYIGKSSSNPQIGDVRITVVKTEPAVISILAKVNGSTFEPYVAKNGKEVSEVAQGTVSAENMFATAHSNNSTLNWIFRIAGMFFVIFGLKMMFSIVETLFKVLPFLSNIVGAGVGLVVTIVGFVWSLLIITISWLFYRPIIAITLLAVVAGAIFYLKKRAKEKVSANAIPNTKPLESVQ